MNHLGEMAAAPVMTTTTITMPNDSNDPSSTDVNGSTNTAAAAAGHTSTTNTTTTTAIPLESDTALGLNAPPPPPLPNTTPAIFPDLHAAPIDWTDPTLSLPPASTTNQNDGMELLDPFLLEFFAEDWNLMGSTLDEFNGTLG